MNNRVKILACILVVLVIGLVLLLVFNKNVSFRKPIFESNAIILKEDNDYVDKVMNIKEGYSFYIDGNPKLEKNNLFVNFYSNTNENLYLKVRVFDKDEIIGESGLLKTGEFLEKIEIKNTNNKNISYLIMSYEKGTYYSMGEIRLNNIKIGDLHE